MPPVSNTGLPRLRMLLRTLKTKEKERMPKKTKVPAPNGPNLWLMARKTPEDTRKEPIKLKTLRMLPSGKISLKMVMEN